MAVQIDWRLGPWEAGPLGISCGWPIAAMSSTGTSMRRSSFFFAEVSTIVTGRYAEVAVAAVNS
jgi:hypothetical protein